LLSLLSEEAQPTLEKAQSMQEENTDAKTTKPHSIYVEKIYSI